MRSKRSKKENTTRLSASFMTLPVNIKTDLNDFAIGIKNLRKPQNRVETEENREKKQSRDREDKRDTERE